MWALPQFGPSEDGVNSGLSLEELERERQKREMLETLKRQNSSQMAIGEPPPSLAPPQRSLEEMAQPLRNVPQPGFEQRPEPRFGFSKFMLGDRQPAPQGDTANAQLQDILRRGPGNEGFLRGLGNAFVPGAMRAFTDTYDEKVARLAAASEAENKVRDLDNLRGYRDAMAEQADARRYAADRGAESRENVAKTTAQGKFSVAELNLIKETLGANGRPISPEKAEALRDDPDVILMPLSDGRIWARSSVKRVAQDKFDGGERPKIEATGEQTRLNQNNQATHTDRQIGLRGNEARRTKATSPGESPSAGRRAQSDQLGAKFVVDSGGDYEKATNALHAAGQAGALDMDLAAGAIKYINDQKAASKRGASASGGGLAAAVAGAIQATKGSKGSTATPGGEAKAAAKSAIGGQPNKRVTLRDPATGQSITFRTDATGNLVQE